MAAEQEVVFGCDGEGIAHEDGGITGKGEGHGSGYTIVIAHVSHCS